MMENYSKLIDKVFKQLNWDHIMKYYEAQKVFDDESIIRNNKKIRIGTKTLNAVKKELKDLVKFVIDSNFTELQHDNWIIFWSNKDGQGYRLEIIFTPSRVVVSDDTVHTEEEDIMTSDEIERDVLKDMLDKSIKEENYELSAVIYSRIMKIEKILKKNKIQKGNI